MRRCGMMAAALAAWCGAAFGATINVPADQSTIQAAVNAASDGDIISVVPGTYDEGTRLTVNKAVTIQPASTGTITVTGSAADYLIYVSESSAGEAVTLSNVVVGGSCSSYTILQDSANITLNLTECQVTNAHATGDGIYAEGNLTISGGAITTVDNSTWAKKNVTVSGCTLTWTTNNYAVRFGGTGAYYARISSCTVSGAHETGTLVGHASTAAYNDSVEVRDCTGTCGQLFKQASYYRNVLISGNTLTLTKTSASMPLGFGVETVDDLDTETNAAPFERIVIEDNTLTYSGTAANHILFLGIGADNADVINNTFRVTALDTASSAYGLVIKSNNYYVRGNRVYFVNAGAGAVIAAFLAGGEDGRFEHNTVYSNGTALSVDTHQDYADSGGTTGMALHARVVGNVLQSTSGLALGVDSSNNANGATWNTVCDRNVYWTGGASLIDIGGEATISLAAAAADGGVIQDTWTSYAGTTISRMNDANSVISDPKLIAPASGNFGLYAGSPAFGAAADGTSIGAWQPNARIRYAETGTFGTHGGK